MARGEFDPAFAASRAYARDLTFKTSNTLRAVLLHCHVDFSAFNCGAKIKHAIAIRERELNCSMGTLLIFRPKT
jgi:hypothetical protein